jgi:hypothetical protein
MMAEARNDIQWPYMFLSIRSHSALAAFLAEVPERHYLTLLAYLRMWDDVRQEREAGATGISTLLAISLCCSDPDKRDAFQTVSGGATSWATMMGE